MRTAPTFMNFDLLSIMSISATLSPTTYSPTRRGFPVPHNTHIQAQMKHVMKAAPGAETGQGVVEHRGHRVGP